MKKFIQYLLAVTFLFVLGTVGAFAQSTNFPDATSIYTNVAAPFNAALGWVIGALGVLVVIGWIMVAIRRKR